MILLDALLFVLCCAGLLALALRSINGRNGHPLAAVEPVRYGPYQGLLERAGWRNGGRAYFFLIKGVALLLGVLGLVAVLRAEPTGVGTLDLALASLVFLAGALGPELGLVLQGRVRLAAIERDLPFVFDLLVSMLDAGLGLQEATERVASEGERSDGPLQREFALIARELDAGLDPDRVFAGFLRRTPLPEVQAIVSSITQAGLHGAGVLGGLQGQADQLRARLHERALRRAESLQTSLVFPVTLCFLPAAVLLAAGPLFLQLMEMML